MQEKLEKDFACLAARFAQFTCKPKLYILSTIKTQIIFFTFAMFLGRF